MLSPPRSPRSRSGSRGPSARWPATRVPFEVPSPGRARHRLASVLEVLYLIFNEGYSAMTRDDWMRPALCYEALRLGRVCGRADVRRSLRCAASSRSWRSRRRASRPGSEPRRPASPLPEQNRGRWDHLLIRRGFTALLRAQQLGQPPGPYMLQAAIAVCHARARTAAETDWRQIALLYEALATLTPSPVVELNQAVAVAMAGDTETGTADRRQASGRARARRLPPPVKRPRRPAGQARPSRRGRGEFRRAAALTMNGPERTVLLRRADDCEARGCRRDK